MPKKRLSAAEKARLAELVAARTPFWKICEEIGRDRWTTRRNIAYLRRLPPPPPKRSPLRLSLAEREEISRGLAGGESLRSIARRLGRAPSTVSREVAAHGGPAAIGPAWLTGGRCGGCAARRPPSSPSAIGSGRWWRPSWSCGGRPSRSPVGWYWPSLMTRRCACRTRRSTCRCTCKPEALCAGNWPAICAADG